MIVNGALIEIAKSLSGESYVTPAYLTVGTTVVTAAITDTSISGEVGSRLLATKSRNSYTISYNNIRLATVVTNPTGDSINSVGLLSASTAGTLFTVNTLPAMVQTTAYDIELTQTITVGRA